MKKSILLLTISLLLCGTALAQGIPQIGRNAIKSPEFLANTIAFRFNAPGAQKVTVTGSWIPGGSAPMQKNADGVWSVVLQCPAPEMYQYNFSVDGVSTLDPSNIFVLRDGTRYFSAFVVPGAECAEAEHHGNVSHVWYHSASLGIDRSMSVYTPYGYEDGKGKYPVLYLMHGGGNDELAWLELGRTAQILDNLIERGEAEPMIVVLPNGNPRQHAAPTYQIPEADVTVSGNNAFDNMNSVASDIVPYIESHYRVVKKASHRAVAGLSMGGGQSFYVCFRNPGMFAWMGSFSSGLLGGTKGGVSAEDFDAEKQVPGTFSNPKVAAGMRLAYFSCGESDQRIGGIRQVSEEFESKGFPVVFESYAGGHEWHVWRKSLASFAKRLFK